MGRVRKKTMEKYIQGRFNLKNEKNWLEEKWAGASQKEQDGITEKLIFR